MELPCGQTGPVLAEKDQVFVSEDSARTAKLLVPESHNIVWIALSS